VSGTCSRSPTTTPSVQPRRSSCSKAGKEESPKWAPVTCRSQKATLPAVQRQRSWLQWSSSRKPLRQLPDEHPLRHRALLSLSLNRSRHQRAEESVIPRRISVNLSIPTCVSLQPIDLAGLATRKDLALKQIVDQRGQLQFSQTEVRGPDAYALHNQ
jgi:hypothetical protein